MHQIANRFAQDFHFIHNLGQTQGICHQVLPEKGFALPGRLIIGSDSHSTTYGAFNCLGTGVGATDIAIVFATGKLWFRVPESIWIDFSGTLAPKSMGKDVVLQLLHDFRTDGANYECFEFGGPGLSALSVDARMSIANMTVEMGAKAGIFEGDPTLANWLRPRIPSKGKSKSLHFLKPTADAQYKSHHNYLLSDIPPLVAKPYRPDNVVPVSELGHVELDEAFLGSCTNGRLEDLRIAARIVKGQHVPSRVKFIVIPASREIYQQAMQEGLLAIFVNAGAMVEYPTCGPCIGGSMGVLGPNEVCISASNRNFIGRMGDPTSQSYLASPAVVAASAITGCITEPIKPIWGEGGI
jgi:homoaconitate hydratase family protein